ncbi:MAG: ornithine cyclodeaminase family protein [Rudaea sp.]
MTVLIREEQVSRLLPMSQALVLVEQALVAMGEGRAENRPRQRVRGQGGTLQVMPAALPDSRYMGFKAYTAFQGGARFYFHLFDSHTGEYLAVIEADRLGQIRTGASSGVTTRHLARQDAARVGIFGSGWQAESQLEAVCAVRPIQSVRCYSRNPERREAFSARMSERLAIPVQPVDRPEQAAEGSDVLITITSSSSPVLLGKWLSPGTHINAAGSNSAHRRELDQEAVARSSHIFVDSLEQAAVECGDLIAAAEAGLFDWSRADELGALLAGRASGRSSPDDITLFESQGIAVEDVAVGSYVYERARAAGIGEPLPF